MANKIHNQCHPPLTSRLSTTRLQHLPLVSLDHALGQRIRSAREARGWSQEQLAEALGVAKRTIGNWERGRPPKQHIGALENLLGLQLRAIDEGRTEGLAAYEDGELVADLFRRLAARTRRIRELEAENAQLRAHATNGAPA